MKLIAVLSFIFSVQAFGAVALPQAPTDPQHPGSKVYAYTTKVQSLSCSGRSVSVYLPTGKSQNEKFPVVVYGHGQALTVANYEGTFQHLAKKGVAVIYPNYDKGFFDQDWKRMGADYVQQAACALKKYSQLDRNQVLYSGHSKGAYVASVAAGSVAPGEVGAPRAVVLFQTAGADEETITKMDPRATLTVIYSDADTIVERGFSDRLFSKAPSVRKQMILVKSYSTTTPALKADHFWPVTKGSVFGGGSESALHYYGSWKWLVGAALDLRDGGNAANPYAYGLFATEKGDGLTDEIQRNW